MAASYTESSRASCPATPVWDQGFFKSVSTYKRKLSKTSGMGCTGSGLRGCWTKSPFSCLAKALHSGRLVCPKTVGGGSSPGTPGYF